MDRPVAVAGSALCASYLLPAMHRLSGGSFSSTQYLLEVQSSEKLWFVLGGVIGVAAIALSFARKDRTRGALLLGLSLALMTLHVPSFGAMADLGRGVCWPLVSAALAAALTLTASRVAIGAAAFATIGSSFVETARLPLPNELHFPGFWHASVMRSLAEGLGSDGESRWMATFYLPALLLPIAVGAVTAIRKEAHRGLSVAAIVAVASVGLGWIVASALPHAREAWDLGVRTRVAVVWAAGVALAALGARELRT